MEEIHLQRINNSGKTKENEIVVFRHEDFLFMITRFKRINWEQYNVFAQYQYFLYIFDKQLDMINQNNLLNDVFNTKIRNNVFATFEDLKQSLDAILSEYILVDDAIFDCLKQVEKLNPIYLDKGS